MISMFFNILILSLFPASTALPLFTVADDGPDLIIHMPRESCVVPLVPVFFIGPRLRAQLMTLSGSCWHIEQTFITDDVEGLNICIPHGFEGRLCIYLDFWKGDWLNYCKDFADKETLIVPDGLLIHPVSERPIEADLSLITWVWAKSLYGYGGYSAFLCGCPPFIDFPTDRSCTLQAVIKIERRHWLLRSSDRGDFNGDGEVNMTDFGYLQTCLSGNGVYFSRGCERADIDRDGDVDQSDIGKFRKLLIGD